MEVKARMPGQVMAINAVGDAVNAKDVWHHRGNENGAAYPLPQA